MKRSLIHLVFGLFLSCFSLNANSQVITTIAGNGSAGYTGDGGQATAAQINSPCGMAIYGNNLYFGNVYASCVRKINLTTGIITTLAGGGTSGLGDGGQATAATVGNPYGVAVDRMGNVYIAEEGRARIRKVNTAGIITTVAGNGTPGYSGDGGAATNAMIYDPNGLAVDLKGNIYIADAGKNCVRKVDTFGIISTFAGTGTAGFSGDGGAATAAMLSHVVDVATDSAGNVYITDYNNARLRKVDTFGIITTIAGNGIIGYTGDGGAATAASCNKPQGMYVDGAHNLIITDINNHAIRKISPGGIINSIAGNGTPGYSGDNGPATAALLNRPTKAIGDASGNLYICDFNNNCIRKITYSSSTTNVGTERRNTSKLIISPNPNRGSFTCLFVSPVNEPVQIIITNLAGQKVKELVTSTNRQESIQLDVPEGVYLFSGNILAQTISEIIQVHR
jgi:trimeric autotransporter adhesin